MRKITVFAVMVPSVLLLFGSCSLLDSLFPMPEVSLSVSPARCSVGDEVTISAEATGFSSGLLSYTWQVNGTVQDAWSDEFTFTVPVDGTWTVTLTVSDGSSEAEAYVDIEVASPGTTRYLNAKKLLGDWLFVYTIISTFTDSYYLDTLVESSSEPGAWYACGANGYGNPVIATYDLEVGFSLLDLGAIIDQFYVFDFTGPDSISGSYYQIDADTGGWSRGYPLSGTRTAPFRFDANTASRPAASRGQEPRSYPEVLSAESVPESLRSVYESARAMR